MERPESTASAPAPQRRRQRSSIVWSSQHRALLGTIPDTELAERMGVKLWHVAIERRRQGLAAATPWRPVTWTPEMLARLGTAPDAHLGAEWGITGNVVAWKRLALYIPAFGGRDRTPVVVWTDAMVRDLGLLSLRRFAKTYGVPQHLVAVERERRGIQPATPRGRGMPDEHMALLGTMPDRDFAAQFGYRPEFVSGFRVRNAIPCYTKRRMAFEWTPYRLRTLGTRSDACLAKRWKTSTERVMEKRRELGIEACHAKTVWTDEMRTVVRTQSQAMAVSILGLTPHEVRAERYRQGLVGTAPRPFTAEEDALLGTMADPQVAARLGRQTDTVRARRRRLGIPAHPRRRAAPSP